MITVKVRSIGPLAALFGAPEVAVALPEGTSVADLLQSLTRSFGEQCRPYFVSRGDAATSPYPLLRIMVNGRDIAVLGGRQAVLANDDEILMLTPVAGG